MSKESIKNAHPPDNSFVLKLIDGYPIEKVKSKWICIKQDFIHKNVLNLYTSYELDTWSRDLNMNFTLAKQVWSCNVNLKRKIC